MAGRGGQRGRSGRRPRRLLALCLAGASALVCPPALTGCTPAAATDPARARVQQLLDRRAAAVLGHREAVYVTTGGGSLDRTAARRAATAYRNLAAVPLASWTYRLTALHRTGATARADAELRYRIGGYDRAPVTTTRTLTLRRSGTQGRWYVTADRPARGATRQLWDEGRVTAVRAAHSLVLGTGQSTARLREFSRLAQAAVPAVTRAWGGGWSQRIVVEVPASLDGMARLLGAPASGYRGIAAVTTGGTGSSGHTAADRIVVNPDAYDNLGALGRRLVLTHETTHVATRTATSTATPLWLSEGYADWVGYRGTGRTAARAAPELQEAVRAGRLPVTLPADADFGFSRQPDPLAEAYEGGWLACRMIAEQWGEDRLKAFYRAVGAHPQHGGTGGDAGGHAEGRTDGSTGGEAGGSAVADALRDVLGVSLGRFTERWRAYLRDRLS